MAKLSPLQRVLTEFRSKADLVDKVLEFLTPPEGESKEDFEERISHLSNTKLLRIWDNQQKLVSKYGSFSELVSRVEKAKFSNGNADYRRKLESYTTSKLLDLARQLGV